MADAGKSIADAYRNWTSDASSSAPVATAPTSDGTSIADAYRAQGAPATPTLPGPSVPSAEEQSAETGLPLPSSSPPSWSGLATALQPAPNTTYANTPWTWLARDNTTGQIRFAMPTPIRDILTGNLGVETTMDPETGKLSAGTPTAGANLLLQSAVPALRFSGDSPLLSPPSPTFGSRLPPTAPELTAAVSRAGETTPRMAAELEARLRAGTATPPDAPPAATGPRTAVSPAPIAAPTTSAEALPIATGLLDKARASGADLTPDYTNKFIDKVTTDATPAGPGTAAVAGPNDPVASMVQRLQALRDQPLNIQDVMGMDQELNARQRAAIKTDPDLARRIGNLQDSLRDQVDSATQANVGGGAEGWQAFQDGRAAYSQYKKMQAVEDMKERADGMTNPTSSYKTAVNNFVNGPKARGWTDEEKASLTDSAERGVLGGTLHMLGSRLIPLVAGGVGLSKYGAIGALATMVGSHYAGDALRNWGNALQTGRVNRTVTGLGSSIQPNQLQQAP